KKPAEDADDEDGEQRDGNAGKEEGKAGGGGGALEEVAASLEADAGEEDGQPKIAEELVGGGGHVPDDGANVAQLRECDRGKKWSAGQADAQSGVEAGHGDGNGADDHAQDDAQKDGNQLRAVESFQGVAQLGFDHFQACFGADGDDAVGENQAEGCGGNEVDAGAGDAGDGDAGAADEIEIAQGTAQDLRAGDDHFH